jgi:hypothetical protein
VAAPFEPPVAQRFAVAAAIGDGHLAYLISYRRVGKRLGSSMIALKTWAPIRPMPGTFWNWAPAQVGVTSAPAPRPEGISLAAVFQRLGSRADFA